jgi:hypothetical protein
MSKGEESSMNKISIIITGKPKTGKSAISEVLRRALELHGINVTIDDDSTHKYPVEVIRALPALHITAKVEVRSSR